MNSIKGSLTALISLAVLAVSVLAGSGIHTASTLENRAARTFVAKDVTADILPPPMYLIEMRLVLSNAIEGILSAQQAQKEFEKLQSEYDTRVDYWKKNPPFGLEQDLLGQQHEAAVKFMGLAKTKVIDPLAAGDVEAAKHAMPEVHQAYLAHREGVNATVKSSVAFAEKEIGSFESARASSMWILLACLLLAVAILVLASYKVAQKFLRRLGAEPEDLSAAAHATAHGDLTYDLSRYPAEENSVMHAMQLMQRSLTDIVNQVRTGVDNIASASTQIAQGNSDLSQRTEQQASSLEETAASMEQMTNTVKGSANSALEANQIATAAAAVAGSGTEVMQQMIATMNEIQTSSKKIADIITVIDGIAFQTNILALNAAVEAARAGEEGRGFAVVASEVRNLAQRSASAAKEIKQLIGTSVEKVDSGSILVDNAGKTMHDIVTQVNRVGHLISEISEAASVQSRGISEVGVAVTQLDQNTQQNAALVEQSSAAAENLRQQAVQLTQLVSAFRLPSVA